MVKYLFFDFDGTISDVKKQVFECLYDVLREEGFDVDKRKLRKLMGEKMRCILKGLGVSGERLEKIRAKFYSVLRKRVREGGLKSCVSLRPLWNLAKEYKLAVVSNSDIAFLRDSIKVLGLNGLFWRVYGADKKKTKDKIMKEIFRKYGISAKEVVYIGDRFSDVEFARKAGCIAVAIHNKCSWSTKREILAERPDFVIRNFRDLRKILKKLN